MKIKIGEAHDLYSLLQTIDRDSSLKLKEEVLLTVIINLNRLRPHAQAYERIRQKMLVDMRENGYRDEMTFNSTFNLRDLEIRDEQFEIELKQIKLADLKPIKGEHHIANRIWLKPMIEDWPE